MLSKINICNHVVVREKLTNIRLMKNLLSEQIRNGMRNIGLLGYNIRSSAEVVTQQQVIL